MNTGLLFVGFLFLINPDLFTVDPLPDAIGYLLIAFGFKKLSYLEERVATARRYSFLLAATGFFKLLSSLLVFSTRVESTRLTVCFCFFVSELALAFLFVDNGFKGIQYLAVRKDGDIALKGYETAKFLLTTFFIVKYVGNFLPQIAVIVFPNIDADPDLVENYTQMRSTFQLVRSILFLLGSVATLFFGVYAARVLWAYRKRIRSDRGFCDRLREDYCERVENCLPMRQRIAIRSSFLWFFAAAVCLADLYVDHIGLIPQPLFALFSYFGLRSLGPYLGMPSWKKRVALAGVFVTAAAYFYRALYYILSEGFLFVFPYTAGGWILGVLSELISVVILLFVLEAVSKCASAFTEYRYQPYRYFLSVSFAVLCGLSFFEYLFVARSAIVPTLEWILYFIILYFHKKSLDEIRDEAEYKLM